MKLYKSIAFLLFLLSSFNTIGQSKKVIYFYEIDDKVAVYVDSKKVYESDVVGVLPGAVEIEVDISNYISTLDEEIKVELYNVICNCASANPWATSFEIRDDDEELDFQNEKGEGDAGEIPVYTYSFTWKDLL